MAMFLPFFFFFGILNLVLGTSQVQAVVYDHEFIAECLKTPIKPQYNGGIVVNSDFNQKLNGWKVFGDAKIENRVCNDGNNFIVASTTNVIAAAQRNTSFHSFSQEFNLDKNKLYSFSAWLQVNHGEAHIKAIIQPKNVDKIYIGRVEAQQGCWSMLKGGFVVDVSGPATLYFESDVSTVEIWGDSISLQPFTHEEWQSHQHQNIEKVRKSKIKFQAIDQKGQPLSNAKVSIKQTRPDFPFGCTINQHILNNTAYKNWFLSRFKYTVFEEELKWAFTEDVKDNVNYKTTDALLQFARSNGLLVRGHTIFWGNPFQLPKWLQNQTDNYNFFKTSVDARINSVMKRYKRQFIHWDVVNENMHFSLFEDKLGPNASIDIFKKARELDPETTLFLNDYFTIEKAVDKGASPTHYLRKISDLRQKGYDGGLGIGLQAHFTWVSQPYIRASLDVLASAKLPIWITELDVSKYSPDQTGQFEQALREIHAHPSVQGINMWGAWNPQPKGCWRMCLTDDNFNNLETGNIVDKFIHDVRHGEGLQVTTDANGNFELSLFHGEYQAKIDGSSNFDNFIVLPSVEEQDPVQLKIGS